VIKSSNLFKSYVYSLSTNKKYQHKAKQCKAQTKANLASNIKPTTLIQTNNANKSFLKNLQHKNKSFFTNFN